MTFKEIKDLYTKNPTDENKKEFVAYLHTMVEEEAEVLVPTYHIFEEYEFMIANVDGKDFASIMTEDDYIDNNDPRVEVIQMKITAFLNLVCNNPKLYGLVIDSENDPVYLPTAEFHNTFGFENPRLKKRDWGKGIPKYDDTDLLKPEELYAYAVRGTIATLERNKAQIIFVNDTPGSTPNVAFIDNDTKKLYGAVVGVSTSNKSAQIEEGKMAAMIEAAKLNNAEPVFIPVKLLSKDSERANEGLALCGDEFTFTLENIYNITM